MLRTAKTNALRTEAQRASRIVWRIRVGTDRETALLIGMRQNAVHRLNQVCNHLVICGRC